MVAAEKREQIVFLFSCLIRRVQTLDLRHVGDVWHHTRIILFSFFYLEVGQAEQFAGSQFPHQGLNLYCSSEKWESQGTLWIILRNLFLGKRISKYYIHMIY